MKVNITENPKVGDVIKATVTLPGDATGTVDVYVDDKLLSNNDYTSKEGSTIIELNSSYLDSLDDKEHTLKVVFNNGEATTKFNVVSKNEIKSISNNPNTSDNIIKYVLITIGSVCGIVVVILCIKTIIRKKNI